MQLQTGLSRYAVVLLLLATASTAHAQLADNCAENSPERSGGIGCGIIGSKLLPESLDGPLFWHIDRFDSLPLARAAAGPAAIALEAAGVAWLMTIESRTAGHHGGVHVAEVGPLPLPDAEGLSMQALSAAFTPGMYSMVHHHTGVEAFYVIEGEQCLQTPERATRMGKGETLAIPAGIPMRVMATGSGVRRALAVIVHDAAQPPTMRMPAESSPQLAACK